MQTQPQPQPQPKKPVTYGQAIRLIGEFKRLAHEVGAIESSRLEFACIMVRELYKRALEVHTTPDVLEMIEQNYALLVTRHEAALCAEVMGPYEIYVCEIQDLREDISDISPGLTA